MPFGLWTPVGPRKHVLGWAQIPHAKGQLLGKKDVPGRARRHSATNCAKTGWTDRFAFWFVDWDGPKEAEVQSYLPGCANVQLTQPADYDWTVRLLQRCRLMSNYVDHLFVIWTFLNSTEYCSISVWQLCCVGFMICSSYTRPVCQAAWSSWPVAFCRVPQLSCDTGILSIS